jgi:hypothetical protein
VRQRRVWRALCACSAQPSHMKDRKV